jgi:exonuclease III
LAYQKKNVVKQLVTNENIEILCLQETEIVPELESRLLSFPGFEFETENNAIKARVGCYIKSGIKYMRRIDLEGINSHLLIIDISAERNLRLINIYRTFCPQNQINARVFFNYQLNLIRSAFTSNTILLGNLNLDWKKKGLTSYAFNHYFDDMGLTFDNLNLIQLDRAVVAEAD